MINCHAFSKCPYYAAKSRSLQAFFQCLSTVGSYPVPLTGLAFWEFLLCAARLTAGGSMMEPGKSWASSTLMAADTASLGGVSGGVIKSGVVFGVGGMTSEGWMKKPGALEAEADAEPEELEGTELWMGPTPDAAAAAEVVWCSLASSLAFC